MVIVLPEKNEFSLYFHLPFCKKKCDYCHFYVLPDRDSYKKQLLESLKREWEWRLPLIKGRRLISIYFGGGTPSLFGAPYIAEILSWINAVFPLDKHQPEITLEVNPEGVTEKIFSDYVAAGINRISLGVQSFDPEHLKKLTREHSAEEAISAISFAKNAGIDNISIDLMYDLPYQTLHSWQQTIEQAVKLPITHLSLYNLTIEPHTVFHKYKNKLQQHLPPEETSALMYTSAISLFEKHQLSQYEISAFAREGYYSKHNTGYWLGREFLGLGPSAFSYWEGKRFRNIAHLNKYSKFLDNNASPVDYEEELDKDAKQRELLAIQIRLRQGVDLVAFEKRYGTLDSATKKVIAELTSKGLTLLQDDRLLLSDKGVLFYDSVATDLI